MKTLGDNRQIISRDSHKFEGLVSVSLLLAFILVAVTGILSFTRMNSIIYSVNDAIHPNKPLAMVKEVYDDLVRADNMVKSYTITRDEQDMVRYNEMIASAWDKVNGLQDYVRKDNAIAPFLDTLQVLVDEKFDILDMYVILNGQYPEESNGRQAGDSRPGAKSETELLKEQELELTHRDKIIMERLRRLIANLESRQASKLEFNTGMAEKEASEVKRIIFIFGAASLLLLLLAGAVIFLYIKRNREYRSILKKARYDAEELARDRQQFLANMSHEIKTPMNVISGYLRQILQNPMPGAQREQLEIVKRSSDHLLQLLGNLLDLSKLQASKLDLVEEDFSPAEVIHDMESWFAPSAREKGLELIPDVRPGTPSVLCGDAVRLRQILFNLIGNAIKFTEKGSVTIRVSPATGNIGEGGLAFEVIDTGIGISRDDIGGIFTEFGQGAAKTSMKTEGSGLGLAITSGLVKLMGGSLQVDSTPGEGSVFRFVIPFKPATGKPAARLEDAPGGTGLLAGLEVLVVDDEPYNRGLLKLVLGKYQCRITEASGGEEAVRLAGEHLPDIVLMDIRMPGMNGIAAAKEIRRIAGERGTRVPVIAISAAMSKDDMEAYRQGGMDDFISKPFEEEKLLASILKLSKEQGKRPGAKPPGPAGYSLAPLRESSSGNEAFFREMVHLFLQNTGAGLAELESLLASGKGQDAADLAHRISAPCRHIRAELLHALLKQIERLSAEGQYPGAMAAQEQARAEFGRIRADILAQPEFNT